jgi:hypothetical protein
VKDVYLFYPGTPIPGEFEQLDIVTATGDKGASDNDVIAHLKMKALNSCTDAIIEIDRRIAPRDSGFIFEDKQDSYHAISYQGTAIRFTDLEALPDHVKGHMSVPGYDSQQLVRRDKHNQSNSIIFELLLSLTIGIAYLISL